MNINRAQLLDEVRLSLRQANRWIYRKTFSTGDRLKLYEELGFLLGNNLRLNIALENMLTTARNGGTTAARAAVWLEDILDGINNGLSLDRALANWVPRAECAIISAGVQDSKMVEALERASLVVRGIDEMKSSVFSQLAYPATLLSVVVGLLFMINDHFLPSLERLLPREFWTGGIWWLGASASLVAEQGVYLACITVLLLAWAIWSLPNVTGRIRRVLDHLIPWSLYRDFQGVVFLLNVAALLGANVRTLEALNKLAAHASPWLLERLNAVRRQVNAGDHLGLAMFNAGYAFPSREAINKLVLLTASQNNDNSQLVIDRYAQYLLRNTIKSMKRRIMRLSMACFALCGLYMILLLLVLQDLNTLADQLGQ